MNNVWPNGKPAVGQTARRSRRVAARDIELFTEISGDRNPLHYDEAFARATKFAGIVVQGGVTSAILNAVVAEDMPGPGTVFLQTTWSFRAPVRPGDTITGEVRITRVRDDKPITELETRVTTEERHGGSGRDGDLLHVRASGTPGLGLRIRPQPSLRPMTRWRWVYFRWWRRWD